VTFVACPEVGAITCGFIAHTRRVPRRNRGQIVAGAYHVWRRTAGPVDMFIDDFDRTLFCNRLQLSLAKHGWTCAAFVLMKTHFHLIVLVEDDVLSRAMHSLFAPYAQAFNHRNGRSGHLRAAPFKLRPLEDDRDIRRTTRYVARNPVRARACERPQDWIWGSYPDSVGYARRFAFVDDRLIVNAFSDDATKARDLLRDFVEEP
jgi:REP element-mobilizing transposase RayT